MPMFLLLPPKPPMVWPLKWVSATRESYLGSSRPTLMWSNHLPPSTSRSAVPNSSVMSTGQKSQPLTFRVSRCFSVVSRSPS